MAAPVRGFGERPEDLDLDFHGTPAPQLLTALLHRCVNDPELRQPETLWDLSVGDRLALLLQVAIRSGHEGFDLVVRCHGCGELIEAPVRLRDLLERHHEAAGDEAAAVDARDGRLRLRRPRARDQLAWQRAAPASRQEATALMVRDLASPGPDGGAAVERALDQEPDPLPEHVIAAVDDALARLDPLVSPTYRLRCPVCGDETEHELDLQTRVLERLARAQRRLLRQVHRLAAAYHWTEADVLRLPAWRRARYIALIESEERGTAWLDT